MPVRFKNVNELRSWMAANHLPGAVAPVNQPNVPTWLRALIWLAVAVIFGPILAFGAFWSWVLFEAIIHVGGR